jgi:Flp pilus assembly protein TadD
VALVAVLAAACGGDPPKDDLPIGATPADGTQGIAAVAPSAPVPEKPPATAPAGPTPGSTASASDTSKTTSVTYGEAERVFQTGEYAKAAELFTAYSERVPTNPWGHYMLGISAWRGGDHVHAEAALRRTIEVDAKHTKGLLNLARVLLEQEKASDALDFVLQVVAMEPELGEGWRVLGNVRTEMRMSDDAAEAYRKAILIDPMDAWTINNLGLLKIQEGKYKEAVPVLARATELRPDVATFQNNLGIALERRGYMAHAATAFRAALASDEAYGKARVNLERVEALIPMSPDLPLDLAELAESFVVEVEAWKTAEAKATGGPGPQPVAELDEGK